MSNIGARNSTGPLMVRTAVVLLALAIALVLGGGLTQMWGLAIVGAVLFVIGVLVGAVGAVTGRG